jgi:hypothetical protein
MSSSELVLLGLGIFFLLLWVPLVAAFFAGKMRDHREPSRGDRRT